MNKIIHISLWRNSVKRVRK